MSKKCISMIRLFALISILMLAIGCSSAVPKLETEDESFTHIDNETGETISALYYSACGVESWGVNRLTPSQAILDGATYFGSLPPGCWDFKVETESGEIYDQYQADLSIGESFSWVVN